MTTAHTPGPWFYDLAGDTAAVIVDSEGDHVIDLVASSHTTAQSALADNARLIASAPDLLAALLLCKRFIDGGRGLYPGLHHEAYVAARDAIARATGA